MRHLAAMHVVLELSPRKFAHTKLSSQLLELRYRDGILHCYDVAGPSFNQMPTYFAKTQYKQPLNPVDGPFQHPHNTKVHFFPWLVENPTYLGAFANYMSGFRDSKARWFAPDFLTVQDRLISGYSGPSQDSAFLVNVGGGKGHDLVSLQSNFPSLPGRLVLQDRPEVIASIDPGLPASITAMEHDFSTPQPTAGARAYFLHSILHDWDDENCVRILKALKPALKPNYSKVLVHDMIVPDMGATWGVTSLDWIMMAPGSVRERTEADTRRLFEAAGLEVENIWVYERGTEAVIEAVLPRRPREKL